jgi:four helix bundle protein
MIKQFEDIVAWQGARALVKDVYQATGSGAFARDFGLRDQLQRAAVSVMSNIAEGFERDNDREFRHFLSIAKASAGEVRSLLYLALDLAYIDRPTHDRLAEQGIRLSRQIAKLIQYLRREQE